MPKDDELEENYRARKRLQEEELAASYGVTPEELALARELGLEDVTDLADPVLNAKRTYDLFSNANTPAQKIRAAKKAVKATEEVIDVANQLKKIFRL